eukprot:COSAG06_NODE_219_length_20015_cov_11.068488_8_plen_118_part_00
MEGANGVFRRIAKRYAENTKSKRTGSKSYLGYWFGSKKGEILREINSLMNNRPVSSLGYQTPAVVLAAAVQSAAMAQLQLHSSTLPNMPQPMAWTRTHPPVCSSSWRSRQFSRPRTN